MSDNILDDLDLDLSGLGLSVPPARGRRPAPVSVTYARDLGEPDIAVLIAAPPMGTVQNSIQQLRHSHHHLARLIAEGRNQTQAAQITGYSVTRVSILMDDPAFQELVEHYRAQVEEVYINVHERLASLGLDALQELHDRLLNPEGKEFTNKELMDMIGLSLDRAGYGPKSTQVNEFKFSVDGLLREVKDEVRTRHHGSIETLEARPSQSRSSGHFEIADGDDLGLETIDYSDLTAEGSEGRGEEVREAGGEKALIPANENGGD